jgi:hypothetical protein
MSVARGRKTDNSCVDVGVDSDGHKSLNAGTDLTLGVWCPAVGRRVEKVDAQQAAAADLRRGHKIRRLGEGLIRSGRTLPWVVLAGGFVVAPFAASAGVLLYFCVGTAVVTASVFGGKAVRRRGVRLEARAARLRAAQAMNRSVEPPADGWIAGQPAVLWRSLRRPEGRALELKRQQDVLRNRRTLSEGGREL